MDNVFSTYTTKDLNLAAFLWLLEEKGTKTILEKHVPTPVGSKIVVYFTFRVPLNDAALNDVVLKYMNGMCSVEPRAYSRSQKSLRDIIYTQKN